MLQAQQVYPEALKARNPDAALNDILCRRIAIDKEERRRNVAAVRNVSRMY